MEKKESADAKERAHKAAAHAAGARKIVSGSSGRDIFDFDPTMLERESYDADDVEWDLSKYRRDEDLDGDGIAVTETNGDANSVSD